MRRRGIWLIMSWVVILALVLLSCRQAVPTEPTEEEKSVTGEVIEEAEEEEVSEKEVVPEGKGPTYGGTLTLATNLEILHFDPHLGQDPSSELAQSTFLEELGIGDWSVDREKCPFISYVPVEYAKGLLAESWEAPDPLTYIFHMRKGVNWHNRPPANGREFTAYDAEYGWHRMLGLGHGYTKPAPYFPSHKFTAVTSVEATDKYTLVFKLSEPQPMMLEDITTSAVGDFLACPDVIEQYGDADDWRHAIGTGPFMVEDYVSSGSLTLAKNPNYWGYDELHPENRIPYVDKLLILIIPDDSTRLAALRTGKVDRLSGLDLQQAEGLRQTNTELQWKEYRGSAVCFNMRNDLEPFTDKRVRKTLQMAINLEEIVETYYGGNADLLPSPVNANLAGIWVPLSEYPEEVQETFSYNPEKAKQLLAEAGFPNGFKTSVYVSTARPTELDMAELAKGYWEKIGVDLEINVMETAAATALAYGRKYETMVALWTSMSAQPVGVLTYWYPGIAWNFCMTNDPEFNSLIDAARVEPDAEKRTELFRQANMYGTSQYWYVGFPVRYMYTFWQPWLKGYHGELLLGVSQVSAWMARVWIDQDLKP
jgi:peptide/nickel transport system substrate-binding protein